MGTGSLPVLFSLATPKPGTYYVDKKVGSECEGVSVANQCLPQYPSAGINLIFLRVILTHLPEIQVNKLT